MTMQVNPGFVLEASESGSGERFVRDAAMSFAKKNVIPNSAYTSYIYDEGREAGTDISIWDVERLPLMVYSLVDADQYGYRGIWG